MLSIDCSLCQQKVQHSRHKTHHRNEQDIMKDGKFRQKVGILECTEAYCNFRTNHKQSLRQHHDTIHLQLLKYACNLCDYKSYHHFHVKFHQNSKIHKNQPMRILRIGCTLCDENLEHIKHSNDRRGHMD